jgi:hypothetical protein
MLDLHPIPEPAIPATTFAECRMQMKEALDCFPGLGLPPVGQDEQFANWVLKWKDVAVSYGDSVIIRLLTGYAGLF